MLEGDKLAKELDNYNAIRLYKQAAKSSETAFRRLCLAKKQIIKSVFDRKNERLLQISFIDWYGGFEPNKSYISELLNMANLEWEESEFIYSDLIVAGCYGAQLMCKKKEELQDKLILFASGENLYPSYDVHDFSITTNPDTFCGKNIRYPQWYSEVTFGENQSSLKFSKRIFQDHYRDLMITAIYNNATPIREEVLNIVREAFGRENIHVYGSHRGHEVDKLEILAKSKINICFENSIGEGYVTEKLLHALSMGCSALYWGDSSYKRDFNANNIFNYHEAKNKISLIEWCHDQLYRKQHDKILHPLELKNIARGNPSKSSIVSHIKKWSNLILGFRMLRSTDF